MSKEAAQRAMREAKFAQRAAGNAPATPAASRRRAPVAPPAAAKSSTGPAAGTATSGDALCGHKSMNGRTCTREQGHSAKNHRYS